MDLNWASDIDTGCTRCGGDAVDWVQVRDGTRRYACAECLEELLRYDTAEGLGDLEDTPQAIICQGCERLTLAVDTGPAGVRCPECAPDDNQEVLEAAQQALADEQDSGA